MQYIVDFDAFSIIFRPKTRTTNHLAGKNYTPENVEFLINSDKRALVRREIKKNPLFVPSVLLENRRFSFR